MAAYRRPFVLLELPHGENSACRVNVAHGPFQPSPRVIGRLKHLLWTAALDINIVGVNVIGSVRHNPLLYSLTMSWSTWSLDVARSDQDQEHFHVYRAAIVNGKYVYDQQQYPKHVYNE